jgi:hypothetical protein
MSAKNKPQQALSSRTLFVDASELASGFKKAKRPSAMMHAWNDLCCHLGLKRQRKEWN